MVASNPEVLAKLMRDANKRNILNQNSASNSDSENIPNPSSYTVPASSLNTITVDFASSKSQPSNNQMSHPLIQKLTSASKGMENKQTCTDLTRHGSNQNAFISNINHPTTETNEMVACQNSSSFYHQNSNFTSLSKENSSKDIPLSIVSKINSAQQGTRYQKDFEKAKGYEIDNKAAKDPRAKIFASFLSSFNTPRSSHHNADKVN